MILKTIGRAREKLQCIVQMGDTTYKAETFLWHDQGHAWKAGPGKNAWLWNIYSFPEPQIEHTFLNDLEDQQFPGKNS